MFISLKFSIICLVARILGGKGGKIKNYPLATTFLEEGIRYCEEKNLNSWINYLLSWKARLNLELGNWRKIQSLNQSIRQSGKARGKRL